MAALTLIQIYIRIYGRVFIYRVTFNITIVIGYTAECFLWSLYLHFFFLCSVISIHVYLTIIINIRVLSIVVAESIAHRGSINISIFIFGLEVMVSLSIGFFDHAETVADIQFHACIFTSVFMVVWMDTLLFCCGFMFSFVNLCLHILRLLWKELVLFSLGLLYMSCFYTFVHRSFIRIVIITNFYIISHFIIFITDWIIAFNIIISHALILSVPVLFLLSIILSILVRSVVPVTKVLILRVRILAFILKIMMLGWSSLRGLILSTEFKRYIYIGTIILLYFYHIIGFLLTEIRASCGRHIIDCGIFMLDRCWRLDY